MFCLVQKTVSVVFLRLTLLTGLILFLKVPFEVEFKRHTYALLSKREGIDGVYDRIDINQIIFSFNVSSKIRITFLYKSFLIA